MQKENDHTDVARAKGHLGGLFMGGFGELPLSTRVVSGTDETEGGSKKVVKGTSQNGTPTSASVGYGTIVCYEERENDWGEDVEAGTVNLWRKQEHDALNGIVSRKG